MATQHPRWCIPNEPEAPIFIQWKGTNVCMDVNCPKCGVHGHIDGDFVYAVRCLGCGTLWKLGDAVSMVDFPAAEWGGCEPWEIGPEYGDHCNQPDTLGKMREQMERDRQRIIALEAATVRLREVRDDLADALHELECGWWATGTVPEMMEAVRVIVRGTVDRATEGRV